MPASVVPLLSASKPGAFDGHGRDLLSEKKVIWRGLVCLTLTQLSGAMYIDGMALGTFSESNENLH